MFKCTCSAYLAFTKNAIFGLLLIHTLIFLSCNNEAEQPLPQPNDDNQISEKNEDPISPPLVGEEFTALSQEEVQTTPYLNQAGDMSMYIPPNWKTLRGIYYDSIVDPEEDPTKNVVFKQFLSKWGFAYMRGLIWVKGDRSKHEGQFAYFQETVKEFASKTNHPELLNVPLIIDGTSRTGRFGMYVANELPGRVISFGCHVMGPKDFDSPITLSTPGFVSIGEKDQAPPKLDKLLDGRSKGALWSGLMMWDAGHITSPNLVYKISFYNEIIRLRLPETIAPDGHYSLKDLVESEGWLGSTEDWHTIASFQQYKGDKTKAVWFPNEYIAKLWQSYQIKPLSEEAKIVNPKGIFEYKHNSFKGKFNKKAPITLSNTPYNVEVTILAQGIKKVGLYSGDKKIAETEVIDQKAVFDNISFPQGYRYYHIQSGNDILSRPHGYLVLP